MLEWWAWVLGGGLVMILMSEEEFGLFERWCSGLFFFCFRER